MNTCVQDGPGRKPFRSASEEYHMLFGRIRGKLCLVTAGMAGVFGPNVRSGRLIRAVDAVGRPVLVRVLDTSDSWSKSMARAVELSRTEWVVVEPQRATCTFIATIVDAGLDEPSWDKLPSLGDMILAVYGNRLIDRADHPLLAQRD